MKKLFLLIGFCITLLFLSSCSKIVVSDVTSTQVTPELIAKVTSTITPTVAPNQSLTVTPMPSDIEITSPPNSDTTKIYSNPIDVYFIPRLNDSTLCEAELRENQDKYLIVWKDEYRNVMKWMYSKCIYKVDKDQLTAYEKSIKQLIASTKPILRTSWSDTYKTPTDERYPGVVLGNGTRSGLNQAEAEIYRDASMQLINDSYTFLKKDYSKVLPKKRS